MFLGHFAVGLAAKRVAPTVSLGTLFLAAQLVDLLWPLFLLAGLEHVRIDPGNTAVTPLDFYDYPITHSLVGSLGWSLLAGGAYFALRRNARSALVVAAAVASHWLLDVVSHRPDMPVFLSGPLVGLGLWRSLGATVVVELGMLAAGLFVYVRTTRPRDRVGSIALAVLVAFLLVIYVGNVLGPPPPSELAIAVAGNAGWLLVLWGAWIDRHRSAAVAAERAEQSGTSDLVRDAGVPLTTAARSRFYRGP
jgi:hypothetical protein